MLFGLVLGFMLFRKWSFSVHWVFALEIVRCSFCSLLKWVIFEGVLFRGYLEFERSRARFLSLVVELLH